MTKNKDDKKKIEYPVYEMDEKGSLVIPPEVIAQITYLHSHCGNNEWSGILLYDVVKGSVSKPKELELKVKHIFLMDIGSSTYTEYETDEDIVDMYDNVEGAMELKSGHIHTHHNGSTFFSGTDTGELQDNVDKHDFYLSLIVNFQGIYSAKVAFLSDVETTSKMNFISNSGKPKFFNHVVKRKSLVTIDMKIYFGELGGFFSSRLTQVREKIAKKKEAEKTANLSNYGNFSNQNIMEFASGNNQRIIEAFARPNPNKMTEYMIEKLASYILTFDPEMSTNMSTYSTLTQLSKQDEADIELYSDFVLENIDKVIYSFFKGNITCSSYEHVIDEIKDSLKERYEGLGHLASIIYDISEVLDQAVIAYKKENMTDERIEAESETIAEKLNSEQ